MNTQIIYSFIYNNIECLKPLNNYLYTPYKCKIKGIEWSVTLKGMTYRAR